MKRLPDIKSIFVWVLVLMVIGTSGVNFAIAGQASPTVSGLATGGTFSFAVMNDGNVRSWGWNKYGQLGNGNNISSDIPALVSGLTGVKSVAAGEAFVLALKGDGTAWSWGENYNGQLGNGNNKNSTAVPAKISGLSGIVAIAAGSAHSLALKSDGMVWAWGSNEYGQLGDDDADSYVPIQIANLAGVVAISAGCNHNLALKKDGTVWSWGWNFTGQLGHSMKEKPDFYDFVSPKPVTGLEGIVAISAGGSHSLALKRDGTVWAWGNNGFGQSGNSNGPVSLSPVQVSGLNDVIAIAAGADHSMALKRDGSLWVWGSNADGQLGNGGEKNSNIPLSVKGLKGVSAIAANEHVLVLMADGTVWGWGFNKFGQVGGKTVCITEPVRISGF